eukprot:COSAG02_NODE_67_length_42609_cov_14.506681_1_plen_73_part_00
MRAADVRATAVARHSDARADAELRLLRLCFHTTRCFHHTGSPRSRSASCGSVFVGVLRGYVPSYGSQYCCRA